MNQPAMNQSERAQKFAALHRAASGFLLPTAWDAVSARLFEAAGFPAIGTTSAGISYARGYTDGQTLTRGEMLREVASIVSAVRIPVTADIEGGYGDFPADVAQTVQGSIDAGAVGINLEDRTGRPKVPLYALNDQVRRLEAARAAADASGLPFVINARTDTFLLRSGGSDAQRLEETLRRGRAYLKAGADVVFVPGLTDLAMTETLVQGLGGPLNLMLMPGGPGAPELLKLGAARVSSGPLPMLAVMGLLDRMARELYSGGASEAMSRFHYGFAEAEALFTPAQKM